MHLPSDLYNATHGSYHRPRADRRSTCIADIARHFEVGVELSLKVGCRCKNGG